MSPGLDFLDFTLLYFNFAKGPKDRNGPCGRRRLNDQVLYKSIKVGGGGGGGGGEGVVGVVGAGGAGGGGG